MRKFKTENYRCLPSRHSGKRGIALIAVMMVLVVTALIVSALSFEMNIEARIVTAQRKRFQADQLAFAAMEVAKAMLDFQEDPLEGDDVVYEDLLLENASRILEGVEVNFEEELGNGVFRVKIIYENGKRHIGNLANDEWYELFTETGIPASDHDELIDCLTDWMDEDELTSLNGAEKDDSFYKKRDYEPKNAPLDTIDELLLIKGWTEEILYGTPQDQLDETDEPLAGVAKHLTTWGSGLKVNPNTASREVMQTMGIDPFTIDEIIRIRMGPDGEPGTADDGITMKDLEALGVAHLFTTDPAYLRITAEGEIGGLISTIQAIYNFNQQDSPPLFWYEGPKEKDRDITGQPIY